MTKNFRILAINPGSTSTKIAVFDDEEVVFHETIRHSREELSKYKKIFDQYEYREGLILKALEKNNVDINSLNGIVGRGGLVKPIEGGTYEVGENMLKDLKAEIQGEHACNLGGIIAYDMAKRLEVKAFIVDPGIVDELTDVARISGLKEIPRRTIFHALNQKAVARRYAKSKGKKYEDMNFVIAHLGGGISVCAHEKGRAIDVPNALDGEGPFSPERAGNLPVGDLIKLAYSGKYTYEEMKRLLTGKGGMVSYLNTNDAIEVSKRIENGDKYAEFIYYAMAYQIAKEIGSMATVLKGDVDAILLTGGIANDKLFTSWIEERVKFISEVYIYPGEDELTALAEGALRVLKGEEEAKQYI